MTPQPHTQIKNVSRFHASFVNSPNVVWLQENVVNHPRPQLLECPCDQAMAGRAARVSEDAMESQGGWEVAWLPLPPPVQDHLIHLLAQRLHVGKRNEEGRLKMKPVSQFFPPLFDPPNSEASEQAKDSADWLHLHDAARMSVGAKLEISWARFVRTERWQHLLAKGLRQPPQT